MHFKDKKYDNSTLKALGIKHGVRQVERSHFVDEDGDIREDMAMYMREERRHSDNDFVQKLFDALIWMRCLAADPDNKWSLTTYIFWA
jgi:hypothetical protein